MIDIILHFVLGAAVGCCVLAKKIGNKAFLLGGLFALIPSVDVLISFFSDVPSALFISGGFTHSLVFCLLVSLIIGCILQIKIKNCSILQLALCTFCAMLSHCLIDTCKISGTALLAPFTAQRFSLSVLSDGDWICATILSLACVCAWIVKDVRNKIMISWSAILACVIFVSFVFLNKLSIEMQYKEKLENQDITYSRMEVYPVPHSLLLWNCIAHDRDGFWMSYQSNFSKNNFELNLLLRNDYYLFEYEQEPEIKKLELYTQGFYIVEQTMTHDILFHDLRYARVGLSANDDFRSSYIISHDADEKWIGVKKLNVSD